MRYFDPSKKTFIKYNFLNIITGGVFSQLNKEKSIKAYNIFFEKYKPRGTKLYYL